MNFRTSIIIYNKKAYVITLTNTPNIYIRSEPVYMTSLETQQLTNALEHVFQAGNPMTLTDNSDDLIKADKLIVKCTKAKSRRELERNSIYYSLAWKDNIISLSMSFFGNWEHDYKRHRELPADTDMETIAKIIIDDALSHPEVLNPPVITQKPRKKLNPRQGEL